jgi:hypothetical protein
MGWVQHAGMVVGIATTVRLVLLLLLQLLLRVLMVLVLLVLVLLLVLLRMGVALLLVVVTVRESLLLLLLLLMLLLLMLLLLMLWVIMGVWTLRRRHGHRRRRDILLRIHFPPRLIPTVHGDGSGGGGSPVGSIGTSASAGAGADCLFVAAFNWLRTRRASERQTFSRRGRWNGSGGFKGRPSPSWLVDRRFLKAMMGSWQVELSCTVCMCAHRCEWWAREIREEESMAISKVRPFPLSHCFFVGDASPRAFINERRYSGLPLCLCMCASVCI